MLRLKTHCIKLTAPAKEKNNIYIYIYSISLSPLGRAK